MFNWLVDRGIDPNRIYIDADGIDAVANSDAVVTLIKEKRYRNVQIITTQRHLARAYVSLYFTLIENKLTIPISKRLGH